MLDPSQISTRLADRSDLPAVIALERRISTAAHWGEEQYEAIFEPPRRVLLVLEEAQYLQGFLIARAVGPEWEIENVVVDQNSRRRGFGVRLIRAFLHLSRSEDLRTVFLEVRESNLAARALYEKCGFRQTGRRTAYFTNPQEDAILYHLSVP